MSDPLSVTGSAVGIISLGIQVAQGLIKVCDAYITRNSDISWSSHKLQGLILTLGFARTKFSERESQDGEQDLLQQAYTLVNDCNRLIIKLDKKGRKLGSTTGKDGFRDKTKRFLRQALYPLRRDVLQSLDKDIDALCSQLGLILDLMSQTDHTKMQKGVDETKALMTLATATQISSQVRSWLNAPDATTNYHDASKSHPGTGQWLVNGTSFLSWLKGENSFLWLNGFAGSGKSVLCATAIRAAFVHRRSNPRIGIAFFFFSFKEESKQNVSAMLRALVLQLSGQHADGHALLSRQNGSLFDGSPSEPVLLECLVHLIRSFEHVFIFVDAVDESPRDTYRANVLGTLNEIRKWDETGLHLLVTSRDEPDIRETLFPGADEDMKLSRKDVNRDISSFVTDHLEAKMSQWKDFYGLIDEEVTRKADGNFRWAELQLLSLKNCPRNEHHLGKFLASLPRSLGKTYERMLLNVDERLVEDARRLLTLLCYAKRPLKVFEVIEGLAVELGDDPKVNITKRLHDSEDILKICPGLVDIRVGDPFTRQRYAKNFWTDHYHAQDENTQLHQLAMRLFRNENGACDNWLKLQPPLPGARFEYRPELSLGSNTALQCACKYGSQWMVSELLQTTPLGYEALRTACGRGDSSMVALLLENGAQVNAKNKWPLSLLEIASQGGHLDTIRLLINGGVDVKVQGPGAISTAITTRHDQAYSIVKLLFNHGAGYSNLDIFLRLAARWNEDIVRLLLEKGADVNCSGHFGQSPLQEACGSGTLETARLLIEWGANVNPPDGSNYGSMRSTLCLYYAQKRGEPDMIKLLLDNGAKLQNGEEIPTEPGG
ncbi:hypothetical protein FZEAL_2495 [Fusarium zealandicum]|uniref:Ankyrin repeat protein n=1 Tax=Fusarium zealandicum TaxID=1053134 RepID=A0A8H4XMR1_9HYPO|nr:hypothetical protein FZEAL_2495 [Fusarium zealandicum]